MVECPPASVNQVKNHTSTGTSKADHEKSQIKQPCWFCGDLHYARDCKYKSHECTKCKKTGHKESYRLNKTNSESTTSSVKPNLKSQRRNQNSTKTNSIFFVSNIYSTQRKYITVHINNFPVKLQIDTASDISLISLDTWKQIGRPDDTFS